MARYKNLKDELETIMSSDIGSVDVAGPDATAITSKGQRVVQAGKAMQRKKIKPMPDPEAGKAARRKTSARKRQKRGGRASTILSSNTDTLG